MIYKAISIPYVGDLLLSTIICSTCKFKITDIWTIFDKGQYEKHQKVSITSKTINNLVCAGSGSTIKIPEIGAEIHIKTFDSSHITTIEGILQEILQATKSLLPVTDNPKRAEEIIKVLEEEIRDPSGRLTLVLNDPSQRSVIVPHEYWVQRVKKQHRIDDETVKKIGLFMVKKVKEKYLNFA